MVLLIYGEATPERGTSFSLQVYKGLYCLVFYMTLNLQQLQGIQPSKLKRYHFSIKGIRNGYLFCQNGTEALYRGDRCSEVEIRVSVWTVRQKNCRCRKVAAVEGWSFMEVRLYLKGERLDAGQESPCIKFC